MDLSASQLIVSLLLSSIGFACFIYGKKQASWKPMAAGVGLVALPYLVRPTVAVLLSAGLILMALYVFRD